MFRAITLRGPVGSIAWGYRPAAVLRAWWVHKDPDATDPRRRWTLRAGVDRADRFFLTQAPLVFTAPRRGGFWCWPVLPRSIVLERETLTAQLGPPEA